MRRVVAWDTWAFLEVAMAGDRASEVLSLSSEADDIVTSRDILAETVTFLSRKPRHASIALGWWDSVRAGDVRVESPDLAELRAWIPARDLGNLSFADLSLAHVAASNGATEIATADAEFRILGLRPLFADHKRRPAKRR